MYFERESANKKDGDRHTQPKKLKVTIYFFLLGEQKRKKGKVRERKHQIGEKAQKIQAEEQEVTMVGNNTNASSQLLIPMFKGENYHLWSFKMKFMFKSQELWDLVENGYTKSNPAPTPPDQQLRETRKKDLTALFFIQSALDDDIFPRIAAATTLK